MRSLSKNKEERFTSMEELVLATGLGATPGESRPSMPAGPSPDASGRIELSPGLASAPTVLATHSAASLSAAAASAIARSRAQRRWATLGIGGLVLLGGLAIVARVRSSGSNTTHGAPATVLADRARDAPLAFQPREPRRLTFDQGCEEYPSLTPDGATVVFDSSVGDDVHVVAMDIATGVQRRLTTQPGWHFSPAVSPDGKLVAYVRQHEDELGTWVVPLDGSAPARQLVVGRTRPTWTPDGRALWAGAADKPQRIDLASGQPTRSLDPPPGYLLLRVTELTDGRAIARVFEKETRRGRGLVLYAATGGPPSTFVADDTEDAIAVSPDGERVLAPKLLATQRVELWQFPLDGSPASLVPGNVALPTKGMVIARDGSRVIWSTCTTEQDLAALRATSDKSPLAATPLEPKTEWTDEEPAGVPGSATRVVVVSDRQSRRQLWVLDVSGTDTPRRLRTGELEVSTPAVSMDDTQVAFTAVGHGIHVVALDGSGDARQLTAGASDTSPTFARDGRAVYFETVSPTRKRAIARVRLDGSSAPDVVVDGGERPSASPVDDRLVYVATDGEVGVPVVMNMTTRQTRPLSPALGKGVYGGLRFSPDGKRVAVTVGLTELAEVDATTGAIVRRFTSADQLTSISYLGRDIVASRQGWRGDLWTARDPWKP
jgi:Tol biopolymer transport system component